MCITLAALSASLSPCVQVVSRQALIQGVDVVEVDTWGMDCYTRRNVFDAVLEADVFKHLRPEQEEFEPDPELDALEAQQQLDAAQVPRTQQ